MSTTRSRRTSPRRSSLAQSLPRLSEKRSSALKRAARVLGAPRTNAKRSTKYNPFQLVPGNPRKSRHRSATNTPCRADRPSPPWARIDAPRQPGVLGVRQRCRVLVPWVDSPTGLSGGCLLCIPDGCAGVLRVGLDAGAAGETRHDGDTLTAPGLGAGRLHRDGRLAVGRSVCYYRASSPSPSWASCAAMARLISGRRKIFSNSATGSTTTPRRCR